jgi:hypothetical protein
MREDASHPLYKGLSDAMANGSTVGRNTLGSILTMQPYLRPGKTAMTTTRSSAVTANESERMFFYLVQYCTLEIIKGGFVPCRCNYVGGHEYRKDLDRELFYMSPNIS